VGEVHKVYDCDKAPDDMYNVAQDSIQVGTIQCIHAWERFDRLGLRIYPLDALDRWMM